MAAKNNGFQFKQFYIEHSRCAMKVGTDSIMLGSWLEADNALNILDIGTGSGLLALMLAQKSILRARILGIDIDPQAIEQAKVNGENSPWAEKLAFAPLAVQELQTVATYPQSFDLIVSNPPYFPLNLTANQQNEHKADRQRIQARQTTSLDHKELLKYVNIHLSDGGCFYCVLPIDVGDKFVVEAVLYGLHLQQQLQVQTHASGKLTRLLLKFSRNKSSPQINKLTIYDKDKHYSQAYMDLCNAFYLRF
ncbi:methyltransferase domain-containing protein [Paraglaciecola sp.]|uniref:tRNA1(Val) (adenine(37)-N6)-methyltransferase n=1 Tax=Paraglaciecola sp. TaxID=1920173 RepID=UPI0030F37C45